MQITRTLRLEFNGTGIRVSSVDPGLAETEFSLVRFKGDAARAKKVYEGTQPLTAEDIAEILVWVASRPPTSTLTSCSSSPSTRPPYTRCTGGRSEPGRSRTYFFGAVVSGKSSVRNGEAGSPFLFQRFTTGQSAQP